MQAKSRSNIHFNRIYIIVAGLLMFFVLLELQLFRIQIKRHDFYLNQSQIQSAKKIALPAQRGIIYDRNQESLATNLIHYDLGIDLNLVKAKRIIAKSFSSVFHKAENAAREQSRGLSRPHQSYLPLLQ